MRAGLAVAGIAVVASVAWAAPGVAETADERFDEANERARAGDYPSAIGIYADLAASGHESASLYWNWAQAAVARGAAGEGLWALLRARELDPADRAVRRDVERLREALNLDPAEIAPEPLAAASRLARRFRLDVLAVLLLALSLAAHAFGKIRSGSRLSSPVGWITVGLGLVAAAAPAAGMLARPTATVVSRGAPLLDAASPSAEVIGTLREGEVLPVLKPGGAWIQVEDASGARGWAHLADVRRLDVAPPAPEDR